MTDKICEVDDCADAVFARGLCQKHYHRQRRTGSIERKNFSNNGLCSVDGCIKRATHRGMCGRHYQQSFPELNTTWKNLRSRYPGQYPPEWETYAGFLADVGEKPSPAHQLRRLNWSLPWSKENLIWREPVKMGREMAGYMRAWADRKHYNVGPTYREDRNAEQNGRCAICGNILGRIDPETNRPLGIALDHDHMPPYKARGLLDDRCNWGLGNFNDDPATLRAAADYIEHWRAKHAEEETE